MSTATARLDPATGLIVLVLDQGTAQDLVGMITAEGPSDVREALRGALRQAQELYEAQAANHSEDPSPSQALTVAADGGCSPNPGPAGWAWVDEHGGYGAGSISRATNNVAELTALEEVLLSHPSRSLHVVYDSQYAVRCVTEWGPAWLRDGKRGKANQEQIERIIAVLDGRRQRGLETVFEWVKGHTGHPLNEAADKLASKMVARADDHVEAGEVDL